MQHLIGRVRMQDNRLLAKRRHPVDVMVGEDDGVYIVNGSEFPKKSLHSVGVALPWYGALCKVEYNQSGTLDACASRKGYKLVEPAIVPAGQIV